MAVLYSLLLIHYHASLSLSLWMKDLNIYIPSLDCMLDPFSNNNYTLILWGIIIIFKGIFLLSLPKVGNRCKMCFRGLGKLTQSVYCYAVQAIFIVQ